MAISINELRNAVSYNPETGKFVWLDRPDMTPQVRSRIVGTEAFITHGKNGYLNARIRGQAVYAHRAAWAISYEEWPSGDVDHINGDRKDNRLSNLRDVSRSENMRNSKRYGTNKSGVTGVTWSKAAQKWQAQIAIDGGCKYLGTFDDLNQAISARRDAERSMGFHQNHGRAF